MKKASLFAISLIMLFACFFITPDVNADSDISIYLDGDKLQLESPPYAINNRTLIPLRSVLESAGANVTWDNEAKLAVVSMNGTVVWLTLDNNVITVQQGGETEEVIIDVAPCIIDGRTYIPIKHVADAFGISVAWDEATRSVILGNQKPQILSETIDISGFVPPVKTTVGSAYSISGSIKSEVGLNRVNIKVTDIVTSDVEINETRFDIDSETYSLSDIDNDIKFGILSPGQKLFEITVVNSVGLREVFSYEFEVIRPTGAVIDGGVSMLWPVPSSGLITTIFWCDNPFCHSNAGRIRGHAAIDIAAPENSNVIAVKDGIIKKTGFGDYENGYSGYGNFIVIDHGDGLETQYSHLFSIYVEEGDIVAVGQVIGGVGNTGNSTGNHLDFNITQDGERCDPLYYLEMHPDARCYEECDIPYFEEAMQKRNQPIQIESEPGL